MKDEGQTVGNGMEIYEVYTYLDNNTNWKNEILFDPYADSDWVEVTEKFNDYAELDFVKSGLSQDTLIKLSSGELMLITESFYQGDFPYIEEVSESLLERLKELGYKTVS